MALVDKNLNNPKITNLKSEEKSVFSYGDYRHNLPNKEEALKYSSKVSQMPKQFLSWDDKKVFNAKYKRDVTPNLLKNAN